MGAPASVHTTLTKFFALKREKVDHKIDVTVLDRPYSRILTYPVK